MTLILWKFSLRKLSAHLICHGHLLGGIRCRWAEAHPEGARPGESCLHVEEEARRLKGEPCPPVHTVQPFFPRLPNSAFLRLFFFSYESSEIGMDSLDS